MPIHPRCRERDSWNETESNQLQNVIPYDFLQLFTSQSIYVESKKLMISKIGSFLLEHGCYPFFCFQAFLFFGRFESFAFGSFYPQRWICPPTSFSFSSQVGTGHPVWEMDFVPLLVLPNWPVATLLEWSTLQVHVSGGIYRDFHISPRNEHSTSEMVLGRKTIFMVSPFELVLKLFTWTLICNVILIAMWMFLQMLE